MQRLHETNKGHFGGIPLQGKHRLASKHSAQADAVEASHQPPLPPDLHAVRDAAVVQVQIRITDLRRDPGGFLSVANRGAGLHHFFKAAVGGDHKPPAGERASKPPGDVQARWQQDGPRVGRPPEESLGALVNRPGENAPAVGLAEPIGRERPANGHEPVWGPSRRRGKTVRWHHTNPRCGLQNLVPSSVPFSHCTTLTSRRAHRSPGRAEVPFAFDAISPMFCRVGC